MLGRTELFLMRGFDAAGLDQKAVRKITKGHYICAQCVCMYKCECE